MPISNNITKNHVSYAISYNMQLLPTSLIRVLTGLDYILIFRMYIIHDSYHCRYLMRNYPMIWLKIIFIIYVFNSFLLTIFLLHTKLFNISSYCLTNKTNVATLGSGGINICCQYIKTHNFLSIKCYLMLR